MTLTCSISSSPGRTLTTKSAVSRVVEFDVLDARQGGAGFVGVGKELVDLSDDGIFEVEFALLRIFPRRGGAELQSVDDGEGAAGSLVFPVPAQGEFVAGAEGGEDDEAGATVLREGDGGVAADDLGAGAQLRVVLLEELFGLGLGDRDRPGGLEHGQRGFLRRGLRGGEGDGETAGDVDAEEAVRPDGFDQTGGIFAFVDGCPRLHVQAVLAAADVDGCFGGVPDADGHALIDADEFDAELRPLREVIPQQGSAEIAEVVRRPVGREVRLPAGAQSRELGEPFLVGRVDVELPGHAVDGAPGQGLLHPVAGLAEHERADREARIRARGDVVLVEEDGVLSFEPSAGDDLDELESQGHGRV
jgi:hypothetical protein